MIGDVIGKILGTTFGIIAFPFIFVYSFVKTAFE